MVCHCMCFFYNVEAFVCRLANLFEFDFAALSSVVVGLNIFYFTTLYIT